MEKQKKRPRAHEPLPMSPALWAYLNLERVKQRLDDYGDTLLSADVRDAMFVIWHGLTKPEEDYLSNRAPIRKGAP